MNTIKQARDEGIETSVANCEDWWPGYALAFLETYLKSHETLFVDDLWDAGLHKPKSPRGLGHVIKTALDNQWIEEIQVHWTCTRGRMVTGALSRPSKASHYQLKRVWKSNLYNPTTT